MDRRFVLRIITAIVVPLALAACDRPEPVQFGRFALTTEAQKLPQDKAQAICRAIEDAGYIMPYGPSMSW
jgi:hypothetical protein